MAQQVELPRDTPEAQGVPSAAIAAFLAAVEREVAHLHSVMLLRHGRVVAEGWWEPYRPASPHMLFSLSKSFTSSAVGLAVAEGRFGVDDPVLTFFPDLAPEHPDANLRAMRVRHLLSMATGHDTDPTQAVFGQPDWARAFLALPVEHAPGTHFVYNTAATYMLLAIVQRLTGQRVLDYLGPRLFAPLGIAGATWETSPQGIDQGGTGLSLPTEAIARFGQLYLQGGAWEGRQLLPAAWVREATARQVENRPAQNPDWEQGYGYQFWRCRHGAYRGDGAFGQFCVVLPEQDAVLAITSGLPAMQRVLDLVWEHLLPALGAAPLPEDRAAQGALRERLASLRLPIVAGERTSPLAAPIGGKTFALAENSAGATAVRFDFGADGAVLTLRNAHGEQQLPCGHGAWQHGSAVLGPLGRRRTAAASQPTPVAGSGAWIDERTYVAHLWLVETPFLRTFTCRFDGDRVTIEQGVNVSMGPADLPTLAGTLA